MKKTAKENIEYYMSLPYTIEIVPYPDGGFFAKVRELEGCMTEGDTLEEVYEMIEDAKRAWLEVALEEGIDIPLPESMREENYSGRILLRLPKSLHKKLAESAKKEGISINAYIISLLSEKNTEKEVIREVNEQLEKLKEGLVSSVREFSESFYRNDSYLEIETQMKPKPRYKITRKQIA